MLKKPAFPEHGCLTIYDWIGTDSVHVLENLMLTNEDVAQIAVLARLRLLPQELDQLTVELQSILQYMDKLRELDTSGVEPFTQAVDTSNAFREDVVTNTPNPDGILANAPAKAKTFFKVPKIIE